MPRLVKSINIAAPAAEVYIYMQTPENLTKIWPGMEEISEVEDLENGGVKFRFVANFAGLKVKGVSEDTDVEPGVRVVNKTSSGIDSTMTWHYRPTQEGTNVTVETDYQVPVPILGRLAEAAVAKSNERDIETLLQNLKAQVEAQPI